VNKMLGVLIVDDEMIVRYGIKSMIDWDKLDLVVVGDASNGREALELFNALKPQIVVTDIKMPVMDGIELIKNIREISTDVKIIILSCLQDFTYAREAIRLGAVEYLVKSDMMPSDLENVLMKVKDTISIEEENLHQISIIRQRVKRTQLIEKEKFLWDLSLGTVSDRESIMDTIEQLGLDYLKRNIFVLCISIDYFEKIISDLSEQEKKDIELRVLDILKKELEGSKKFKGEIYSGNNGEINMVVKVLNAYSEKDIFSFVYALGEDIIKSIKAQTNYSATIGVSNWMKDMTNIKTGYYQAQMAYKFKTFFGCGKVIHYASTVRSVPVDNHVRLNIRELHDCVYFLKRDEVNRFIEDIFSKMTESLDFEGVNLISLEFVLVLSNIYSEICNNDEDIIIRKKEYYDQLKYLETVTDIKNWVKDSFGYLMDTISSVYNNEKNTISKALKYINENYSQEINLHTISDYVHLSKNYFVNFFKREVGESFIEYLTKVRVENAKALLKIPELRVSDVGRMVGIDDQRYFSKVFKKITGRVNSRKA